MRGKGTSAVVMRRQLGITPAYAGKSRTRRCWTKTTAGSPPRMRGKASGPGVLSSLSGITPAYAGKSSFLLPSGNISKDHPRVCGEKWGGILKTIAKGGSPPRMRGKASGPGVLSSLSGITPAYAGKSSFLLPSGNISKDHPRVCGEKWGGILKTIAKGGSPPRMRGKVQVLSHAAQFVGITPAYAGKRPTRRGRKPTFEGSPPRMRGKGLLTPSHRRPARGSPPRMRGKD